MTPGEIAKDILVALLEHAQIPGGGDRLGIAKWTADAYRIIYEAVLHPTKDTKAS